MAIFNLTDVVFSQSADPTTRDLEKTLNGRVEGGGYSITRYPKELATDPSRMHYVVFHINVQSKSQFGLPEVAESTRSIQNRIFLNGQRGNITPVGSINSVIGKITGGFSGQAEVPNAQSAAAQQATPGILDKLNAAALKAGGPNSPAVKALDAASAAADTAKQTFNAAKNIVTTTGNEIKKLDETNFLRTTRRTSDTIALYMPHAMQYSMSQSYSEINLADILGPMGSLLAAGEQLAGKGGAANITPFIRTALESETVSNAAKGFGIDSATAGKALQAAFGFANNPQIELIYERPSLRDFNFEFAFYPRDRREAQDVQKIIRLFRFHAAPEIASNFGGRFLIPPSNFDIMFYHNGIENPNIPKITTCVLTGVNATYNTASNYEIPLEKGIEDASIGGTGMPYQINLSLSFRETEVITKELISLDDNTNGNY